jgi:hypothetical protein
MADSGPSSLEAADAQRRGALLNAESCAREQVVELASLQEACGRLHPLRSDMRQTESQISSARFSIGRLSMELQQSLGKLADTPVITARHEGEPRAEEAEP